MKKTINSLENLESLEKLEKLYVLFLGMNPIEGEDKQFAKDNIEREEVKKLLQSYRELMKEKERE
ncbi:MAG: hypothetical protein HWN80_12435 [Candidatus Lokiarchaeota archaeon]|nr:hypothetical protein [Candidatus Lokiarchaeota archaeon]